MSTLLLLLAFAAEVDLHRASESIIAQTNEFRGQHDQQSLKTNGQLQKAARYFADYMARTGEYDHEADGKTPAERAEEYCYEYCIVLENIAHQFRSRGFETKELARALAEGWQQSPAHRENMLDPDITETGVAIAQDEKGGFYAVQMFGRPKSQQIEFEITNDSQTEVTYELADEEYSLPPRSTRTHRRCRPPKLVIHLDEDQTRAFNPRPGDRLAIVTKDDELRVERR